VRLGGARFFVLRKPRQDKTSHDVVRQEIRNLRRGAPQAAAEQITAAQKEQDSARQRANDAEQAESTAKNKRKAASEALQVAKDDVRHARAGPTAARTPTTSPSMEEVRDSSSSLEGVDEVRVPEVAQGAEPGGEQGGATSSAEEVQKSQENATRAQQVLDQASTEVAKATMNRADADEKATQATANVTDVAVEGDEKRLAALEAKLRQQASESREQTEEYLRNLGRKTMTISFLLLLGAGLLISLKQGWRPLTACGAHPCTSYHQAWWAGLGVWAAIAALSLLKRGQGGVVSMLVGKDGRFSTSYFQAWLWTLVICWGFAFFIVVAIVSRNVQPLESAANQLDADYFLLLGGPFAALVVAQQIKTTKLMSGDLQQVESSSTTVKDLFSSDDGRADLVDTQYLFFNFVALATFFVLFARRPDQFPNLPDGLVMLTSGAALAYIGNKAVQRNAPGIKTITCDRRAGTPRVGDVIRIHGFNFVPAGAQGEEYLARVRVRFDNVDAPVDPPANDSGDVSAADKPVVGAEATPAPGTRRAPMVYADNVSPTEVRIAIPPLPDLDPPRMVNVRVVTAAGAETEPHQLLIQSRPLQVTFPNTISAGKEFNFIVSHAPVGEWIRLDFGEKPQDLRVGPAGQVTTVAPFDPKGQATVVVQGLGGSYTTQAVVAD